MISLDNIEKIYTEKNGLTIQALKRITLNIGEGEIFGILGRKDTGISTLIRCFNLLERPTRGSIIVDQCDLTTLNTEGLRQARRKIGMIFQHFNLLSSRSVFDNVALPLEINKIPKAKTRETVYSLLQLTGLYELADRYPADLSPVQKQKVAIARALANSPKVLLCDEATAGLDHKSAQSIFHLLNELNERLNLTIVLITHEIEVIKSLCHRVAVFHQGEIVEEGSVFDLFASPKSEISKEYIKRLTRFELPMALKKRLRAHKTENSNSVLRLSFVGQTAQEPLIAYVIQQFNLMMDINQAHLENIHDQTIGVMIVEVMGEADNIQKAIKFMEQKGLHIEVLGYASRINDSA